MRKVVEAVEAKGLSYKEEHALFCEIARNVQKFFVDPKAKFKDYDNFKKWVYSYVGNKTKIPEKDMKRYYEEEYCSRVGYPPEY